MPSIPATAPFFLVVAWMSAAPSSATGTGQELPDTGGPRPMQERNHSTRHPEALGRELVRLMREGIETRSPNHSFFGPIDEERSGAPFDGSYDWHSAVIAHWALLNHARTAADGELERWVVERLDREILAHHAALLERRAGAAASPAGADRALLVAQRTFPDHVGWFLMLLAERARRGDGSELLPMREAVEARLLD
ncbi:MAG: DUF2891 family protein, partial [Planctomycetota bacterium]|nr:DUF2891 family protein [Planctomycetota bacterium]